MRLEPIRRCRDASYPMRDEVDANPEVLRRMPGRWLAMPLVMSLAGAAGLAWMQARYNPVLACECSGIPPQIQLAELDARRIIADEAAKAMLDLGGPGRDVSGVRFTSVTEGVPGFAVTVHIDGSDAKREVSYAYLSDDVDVPAMNKETPGAGYALVLQDTDHLTTEVRSKAGESVGVFVGTPAWSTEDAEGQLRRQVRDFIAYLKAQGVI